MTSDEYKPYREAILEVYGQTYPRRRKHRIGRKPKPGRRPPAGLLYATVEKHRRRGRVVRVSTHLIYGKRQALQQALEASPCSRTVNIAFVERYNGTDRHQNARKVRRSYMRRRPFSLLTATTSAGRSGHSASKRRTAPGARPALRRCLLVWPIMSGPFKSGLLYPL